MKKSVSKIVAVLSTVAFLGACTQQEIEFFGQTEPNPLGGNSVEQNTLILGGLALLGLMLLSGGGGGGHHYSSSPY